MKELDEKQESKKEKESINLLFKIFNADNVAEVIEDDKLKLVADQVIEDFNNDVESMDEWLAIVEKGKELMSQQFEPRSEPWEGAANFKTALIMNAVLAFGDTASQELLRKPEVVKTMVFGKDPNGEKEKQGSRISQHINYQINVKMKDWRTDHDKMLYILPSTGCSFKKTFYDPSQKTNVSDIIFYPNFAVDQSNTTINDFTRFTHILQLTKNEVVEKQRAGVWVESDFVVDDENITEQPEENIDRFLEQQAWIDLDDDGYKEPYVITVHEASRTVVKIAKRYSPKDIKVKFKDEVFNLNVILQAIAEGEDVKKEQIDEVVSIKGINLITKYDFLPDPSGGFLGIGYPHLLCGVSTAINTTTNHLLDAGTLSNLPGGYLAKGVKKKLGEDAFKPGQWKSTNVPPRDFANAFFPLPYGEPSQTLFALNEKMQVEGERTASNADFSKVLANNAPATTTLALLQKETQSTTSIIRRIYLAMSEEFKKMAELNRLFPNEEEYQALLDDQEADYQSDYDIESLNLVPVSNPEMSTRIERVKSSEVQLNFLPQIEQAGGQSQVVIKGFLDALGVDNIDQIFPEPQPQQIEIQNQELQKQNQLNEFQNSLFDRELAVRESDIQRKILETESDISETRAKILKIQSEVVLNLESAETEEQKNRINVYTSELNGLITLLSKVRGQKDESIGNNVEPTIAGNAIDKNQ